MLIRGSYSLTFLNAYVDSIYVPARSSRYAPVVADKTSEEDEEILHAIAASMESIKDTIGSGSQVEDVNLTNPEEITCQDKKPCYPLLTEEPKGDKTLLCRVGIRLPDGRRVQRNFFHTDPIQLLWSFCCSQLTEAETKAFRLTQAIPGASKTLDYDSKLSFEESELANSMISVTWE
ncbi:hypothetical protein TIFTF001_042232 [Ficus carica]|uniref:UBX domain-containing protein n=1 Tax=Ficus carica TaxID=3494 RepID=A0AA88CXE0_FICCA|nr:hypothetical protein TIFTF001_042232 [Ficus carica]